LGQFQAISIEQPLAQQLIIPMQPAIHNYHQPPYYQKGSSLPFVHFYRKRDKLQQLYVLGSQVLSVCQ